MRIRILLSLLLFMTWTAFPVPLKAEGAQTIVIDYQDASLASVLKALAYSHDLNIVMSKDIQGSVSATLENVTIDEALDAILSINGYTYTRKGDIIYIVPGASTDGLGQSTRAFHLNYLTANEAEEMLEKTVSSRGSIKKNVGTNSLIITDYDDYLDKVTQVLKEVDIAPIQVLIEARIVDIQSTAYENIGTSLSFTYDPRGSATGGGIFGRSTQAAESASLATSLEGPSQTLSGDDITLGATLKSLTASATIDALIQENKARVLASPSIATLNGKEARIIIGERFPVLETTQSESGSTTENTEFVDVGTTLNVTPLVSPDGWITMNVHPEVSSVSSTLDAGPRITTREAHATVRVRDNQTIIIGGLISKENEQTEGGVPGLRKIPFLGKLFSRRSKDIEETELVVFITPHIIRFPDEVSTYGKASDDKIYFDVKQIQRMEIVDEMYQYVDELEERSLMDMDVNLHRQLEIINTYQTLLEQFPDSTYSDRALFRIGYIYFKVFGEYGAAKRSLAQLVKMYPNSSYTNRGEELLRQLKTMHEEK